ncbi:MAG TPA: tRNA (adenosine(37)-N6)-threonylcarbamoyltransferase complex transferase subunit TsaD [Thermoleophilia bacterium]|nr:tRNA (adenosine(37)-N6)-threonylcarbamoyltransferase complex transferase subunit TsaD [Thermoleophilia bacterium]
MLLCLETSCDDTSAAVVDTGAAPPGSAAAAGSAATAGAAGGPAVIRSSIVSSQHEFHAVFGGVVPEVASRRHTELLAGAVADAFDEAGVTWDDLDGLAVTTGPGLIGALLVGLAAAKAMAYARRLPLTPVDHLQGHLAAGYALGVEAPFVSLTASGGHTLLSVVEHGIEFRVVGRTLDDAAGEAFDKGARLLGLPYPGGRELDLLAAQGDPAAVVFPRSLPHGFDFSFSGLKTALLYYLREHPDEAGSEARRASLAASYQEAIVDQLVSKTVRCAEQEGLRRVAVGGGVAANSRLRRRLAEVCEQRGLEAFIPPVALCTDNAAMVGLAAAHLGAVPWPDYLDLDAYASEPALNALRRRSQGGDRRS